MEALLIFPHHLFQEHPGLQKGRLVILVEDQRFFSAFRFHKQKLILHRASMKSYEKALQQRGFQTAYIEGDLEELKKTGNISRLHVAEPDDHALEKRLATFAKEVGLELKIWKSPAFLTPVSEFFEQFQGKKRLKCETFYIQQRKRLGLLLDEQGNPIGGRWSFDQENRKKVPKTLKIPRPISFPKTEQVQEAIAYVEKRFPENPGASNSFNYPVTHAEAERALAGFFAERFASFGDYQDAMVRDEPLLFHSCLSPLLNTGLLTPQEVLEEALLQKVPMNSLEGFVRQIVGWREFVRGAYHLIGEEERKTNFFQHVRPLPKPFYSGNTGILPLDDAIGKLQNYAYLHHIERLMLLGNFFVLAEIDPKQVYNWFMELFIDAYDWVMVPNVFGMSQYADGGMITTKPYISSSHYILKMSNYPKGEWCAIWDALFWRFMIKYSDFFEKQPRMQVLCGIAKKKREDARLLAKAENFIRDIF